MSAKQIVVLGGGFAGLWSAVGADRKLDELGHGPEAVEVTLVNRDGYHGIRVRNYEADLRAVRVPLDDILGPIGVRCVEGEVADIDLTEHTVTVATANGHRTLPYDRLVCALGSQLLRPNVPGLAEHGFDVDTYGGAARLNTHLQALPGGPASAGQWTVIVVGAGLTGIEAATEMPGKLRAVLAQATRHGHSASSWSTISRGSAQTWEHPPGRSSRKPSPRWGSRRAWVLTSSRSALPG
jgi:NADH:ubiquinone reductase (H+-translocating)